MKNTITRIIAAILTFAIAFTSISFSNATTVNAMGMTLEQYLGGALNEADYQDTPFTMEIGDKKYFKRVIDYGAYWSDSTHAYDWSVSDESIVTIQFARESATSDKVIEFMLIAEKAGTTTVIGKSKESETTVSMTVIVKGATVTQTSCKHSWKTTKKATCLFAGTKTCKKCHMKKSIKRKTHNWVTGKETKAVYKEYTVFECNYERYDGGWCGKTFSEKEYGSYDAARNAWIAHQGECPYTKRTNWVFWTVPEKVGTKKVTVTRCTKCGETPESAKQYE